MTRKDRTEGIYSRREVLDESERRQYCLIQLKDLLSYAYRYSEDVKKRFDRAQFNVEKFKTLSDIKHIPILKKKELIFLQSMAEDAKPLLAPLPGEARFNFALALESFSASARMSLRLNSVFYMSALLYPDNHRPGQPDNLTLCIERMEKLGLDFTKE